MPSRRGGPQQRQTSMDHLLSLSVRRMLRLQDAHPGPASVPRLQGSLRGVSRTGFGSFQAAINRTLTYDF